MLSSKRKKWLLITLGVFLFLLLTAQTLVQILVEPSIEAFVRELVEKRSSGNYKVKSIEVDWDLSSRTIALKELAIDFSTEEHSDRLKPENRFSFHFPLIELEHIFLRKFLSQGIIHGERLSIDSPEIQVIHSQDSDSTKGKGAFNLYEKISPQIKEIRIDEFALTKGKLSYNDEDSFKRNSFVADELSFSAKDV
ncbi:MAG: hypothetical protein AAF696_38710, partial [Bacteroidota bacterium]